MKKFIFMLGVIASMFGVMTSCSSNDELLTPDAAGSEVNVSFDMRLSIGASSRVAIDQIGKGTVVDHLYYTIYEVGENDVFTKMISYDEAAFGTEGTSHNTSIRLVAGAKYVVAFWAQKAEGSPYTYNEGVVEINYDGYAANNEAGDAFYGATEPFIANSSNPQTINLKRPFAQLNIGTSKSDFVAFNETSNIGKLEQVGVKVNLNRAEKFDVRTGLATKSATATYEFAPADIVDAVDATGQPSTSLNGYVYLSYNYIIPGEAAANDSGVADVELTSTFAFPAERVFRSIPLRRNFRTNILGNLLCASTDFKVVIAPGFVGDIDAVQLTSVEAANEALLEGKTNISIETVTAPSTIEIPKAFEANDVLTIELPDTEETVTFVQSTEGSESYPKEVVISASDLNKVIVNAPNLTVIVNSRIKNLTATVSPNTLIIEEDAVVENLTLLQGNVEILGEVQNIEFKDSNSRIKVYNIRTAAQLQTLGQFPNRVDKAFLLADIDLDNKAWSPIGPNADSAVKFTGVFEGNGHVIRNLKVDQGDAYHAAGLFGALNGTLRNFTIDGASIKSISGGGATDNGNAVVAGSIYTGGLIEGVTVRNATINANRYIGGISGYTYGKVLNCKVENLTIVATPNMVDGEYDNGDKVGGIVGYFPIDVDNYVSGNTAINVKITAVRDFGGIAGAANQERVTNNTVYGLTLIRDNSLIPSENRVRAGAIVGYLLSGDAVAVPESNTATNVKMELIATPATFGSIMSSITENDVTIKLTEGTFVFTGGKTVQVKKTFVDNGVSVNEHDQMSAMRYENLKEGMNITIIGAGKDKSALVISDGNWGKVQAGGSFVLVNKANITFKNMTQLHREYSILDAKVEKYENCEIWGHFNPRSETVSFNDCEFYTQPRTSKITGLNDYPAESELALFFGMYSRYLNFDNCNFYANQNKAVQIYASYRRNVITDVTATNCTLYGGNYIPKSGKRAFFEIHNELGIHGNLTLKNCKINEADADNWGGGLWVDCDFGNQDAKQWTFNVKVDGTLIHSADDYTTTKFGAIENPWTGDYTIQ